MSIVDGDELGRGCGCPLLRVLLVTTMWPTDAHPTRGPYVRDQVEKLREMGVRCDVLTSDGGGIRAYLRLARATRRRVREARYDVVHAHYGFGGIAARAQFAVPLVVTFHGSDVNPRVNSSGSRTIGGRLESISSRVLARLVDQAIVVSVDLARALGSRATVIPVGVDLAGFVPAAREDARAKLNLRPEAQYVMFAADAGVPLKRYALAAQAVRLVQEDLPDAELIAVHGRPHQEMPAWMNACDVLIITSTSEGSSVVLKEALACNLPVVSVPVGDAVERLGGVEGCRVVAADAHAIADALKHVLRSPRPASARRSILELDTRLLAKRVVEVYRSAMISH
jgi:teichuronic acid biosynthesis glycosyltransferase TuaC